MLENIEGAIKNGQSRESDNIGYTRQRKPQPSHNKIGVGHYYNTQTKKYNVNKTIPHTNNWRKRQTKHRFNAEI